MEAGRSDCLVRIHVLVRFALVRFCSFGYSLLRILLLILVVLEVGGGFGDLTLLLVSKNFTFVSLFLFEKFVGFVKLRESCMEMKALQ